ncbi:MAG: Gfo/Idh/MocA family protein [Acidobacteriota bacterium]
MTNRRVFFGQIAGLAAAGRVMGANDRIRIGWIGAGARGKEIFRAALKCPNVEAVAVADVYTRRLDEARAIAPQMKAYRDYRELLEDKTIDAVLIATPQHQHALSFVAAIQAGKDVYQEKTMAFNPAHARRMRKAFENSGRVVQIGMQMNSGDGIKKIKELITPERMGTIQAIQANHYRNAPYGGWMRKLTPDCDTEHIDWPAFEAEAAHHSFDPDRYLNWRFYWDYSGGNVFENMIHQVGFWYEALGLNIPESVTMTGANYLSPKMQVPDTMNVSMSQPEKILFTWNSMFSNNYYGEGQDFLFGSKGTIIHTESDEVIYQPQGKAAGAPPKRAGGSEYLDFTGRHMQNFFDCVRSRKQPVAPFELGFRSSIAVQMAIASYRRQTTVRWDPMTEEII